MLWIYPSAQDIDQFHASIARLSLVFPHRYAAAKESAEQLHYMRHLALSYGE